MLKKIIKSLSQKPIADNNNDDSDLNLQQKKAVEIRGSNILVLAGAGTGKTWTIVSRVANLIKTGENSAEILLLTFTRKAAHEMKGRLKTIVGERSKGIFAGTFHSFCLSTMRKYSNYFPIKDYTIIDRDDQLQLMRLCKARCIKKGQKFLFPSKLVDIFSYARNTNASTKKYLIKYKDSLELDDKKIDTCLKIFKLYENRKKILKYLDYDDILYLFASTIHKNEKFQKKIRSMYKHILVDEMQDTNPIQWMIIEGMRDPAYLFCVGDDAQSIYAFRGADFKNVHSFKDRIPNSKILKLEKNCRSFQEILDLSNWLLKQSKVKYNKKLIASKGNGIKPRLIDFDSEWDEANWISDDILERHNNGSEWSDQMVLVRTGYIARVLEASFVEKNIPYVFYGGTQLFKSAHIRYVLSALRVTINFHDELAWMRYLTLFPKIGDITASRFIDLVHNQKDWNTVETQLSISFNGRKDINNGLKLISKNNSNCEKAVKLAVEYLSPRLENMYERWKTRKKDLDLLVRLSKKFDSLKAFIETYTLDPIYNVDPEDKPDLVTLSTIHSAKGTEAPTCYVIKAQVGIYPHVKSLGKDDEEEEERRIMYVGLTRAKDDLILTRSLRNNGNMIFQEASGGNYFLENIPKKIIDSKEMLSDTLDNEITINKFD